MAFSCSTDAIGKGSGFVVYHGSFSGSNTQDPQSIFCDFESTNGDIPANGSPLNPPSGSFAVNQSCPKDISITWRAKAFDSGAQLLKVGSYSTDKTYANSANFPSGLTPGTPTPTTCPISGSVVPNTVESAGTVTAEYRVQGTGTWLVGPTVAVGLSGSGSQALAGTLTALNPATTYEARYHINRNTANSQDAYSATGTFTTQASSPILIGPPVMDINFEMPTPTISGTIIAAPLMDIRFEMPIPGVASATTRVITRIMLMNDEIKRDFRMS